MRFLLPLLVLEPRDDVVAGRAPDETCRRVLGRSAAHRDRRNAAGDGGHGRAVAGLDDHLLAVCRCC